MKKFISSLVLVGIVLLTVTTGCKKTEAGPPEIVDPANANRMQEVISIAGGVLRGGNFPTASVSGVLPYIIQSQSSGSTNPGYQLVIPLQYFATGGVSKIYLQITGATNGYFTIDPAAATTTSTGYLGITISIPANVALGEFDIIYSVQDVNGLISTYQNTGIVLRNPLDCSTAYASGEEGLTFTNVTLGSTSGIVRINYDTYSVPDRIDVYQGNTWLTGTGTNPNSLIPPLVDCTTAETTPGFIGEADELTFNYNPANGNVVTVVVSGCTGGGTRWDWNLVCP